MHVMREEMQSAGVTEEDATVKGEVEADDSLRSYPSVYF